MDSVTPKVRVTPTFPSPSFGHSWYSVPYGVASANRLLLPLRRAKYLRKDSP